MCPKPALAPLQFDVAFFDGLLAPPGGPAPPPPVFDMTKWGANLLTKVSGSPPKGPQTRGCFLGFVKPGGGETGVLTN